ncbi:MAG TPA: hypothetical protein PKJ13_05830 [bacterium]|jgi:hypothetical protein|nr:hypothetical protein [bacterium]HOY45111.1 hypothetical protein [bacterium]HPG84039.1 hypothetical protein [bacterium]HPM60083.1 hypothetical protein [bacterium]
MKKGMMTLVLAGLLAGFSYAADSTATLDSARLAVAVDNYKMALKSDNPGVRSSALYMLALIRSRYPEANISGFNGDLARISRKDADPLVRVQANLILTYLNSDSLHTKIRIADPEAPLAFYSELFTEITMNPEEIK